jgi:glycosyltransferase involved in cell wall biosynthesis
VRPRVAVLTSVPSPYQVELFNAMAEEGSLDLRVWYCAAADPRRSWRAPELRHWHRIGRSVRVVGRHDHYYLDPRPGTEITAWNPDLAVLSVYSMPAVQLAMWLTTFESIPWAYWGEAVASRRRGAAGRALRSLALLPMRRHAVGLMAVGRRAVANFRTVIGSSGPVLNVPYFSDLKRFGEPEASPHESDEPVFLYVGAFSPRKGVDLLARAFSRVLEELPSARLIAAGDGDPGRTFEPYLSARAAGRVERRPFVPWDELPRLYRSADILVFPSRYDGWGMVVPEAMASGLPVIGSTAAGATVDLVREGLTGWQVPPDDEVALAGAMLAALRLPADRRRNMGAACRARARRYDADVGVRVFRSAVRCLTRKTGRAR